MSFPLAFGYECTDFPSATEYYQTLKLAVMNYRMLLSVTAADLILLGLKLTIPSSYYVVQWNIVDVIDSLLQRHIGEWSLVCCNKNLCIRFPLLEEVMLNKLLEKVDGTIMHNGILIMMYL